MSSKNKTPAPVEDPLVDDTESAQVSTPPEPRKERGLVERRMNTLEKRARGDLNNDSSDPEDVQEDDKSDKERVVGDDCTGVGIIPQPSRPVPNLIDIDQEMDQAATPADGQLGSENHVLPSPPRSLTLSRDSESEQDLVTVSPCEQVLEPCHLEMLSSSGPYYEPDLEVMRALDEMAAPAAEIHDMVNTREESEWNCKSDVRWQIQHSPITWLRIIEKLQALQNDNKQEIALEFSRLFAWDSLISVFMTIT